MAKILLVGRVIDVWSGTDPKYPNVSLTFTDTVDGGQVKLRVPPDIVKRDGVVLDGKYEIDCQLKGRNTNLGLMLDVVSGTFKSVDGNGSSVKSAK